MTSHILNLPDRLKQEVEQLDQSQGISLDQFVLWAVTEKVGTLKASFSLIFLHFYTSFALCVSPMIVIYTCRPKPTLHLTENPSTNIAPNAQYPN